MFRFLYTADIHLDSSLKGFEAHADSPVEEILGTSRQAFDNCIDLAVNEAVEITRIIPVPHNVTLYEPRSQVRQLLRPQLLRHGEPQ